jgi:hypothetical protein
LERLFSPYLGKLREEIFFAFTKQRFNFKVMHCIVFVEELFLWNRVIADCCPIRGVS